MAAILVVEDDVFIREYAEAMIHDWGHEILSACDVPEALVHLRSAKHIDALFTDIYLKDQVHGGCDLARQAIVLRPELRVLYTTANRVTDALRAMFASGTLTIFGITQAETHGRRVSELGQHQWDVPALRHLMEKVLPEDKPIENFEIEDNFPVLGRRVFNLNARKISQPGNNAHRILLVFEDITDRKQRERDAQMLTNEISHRIKNNLQIVVGLIAYEIKWAVAASVPGLKAMQARIGAIADLYDLLSHSSRGRAIAVDAYLREIAKSMSAGLLGALSGIEISVKAAPLEIDPDRAVHFGLLVNELATNAIKHAFPTGKGHLTLSVEQIGEEIELTVADDGIGIKDKVAVKLPEKRGSDYVAIFVRQLGGTIAKTSSEENGTVIKIRLPLLLVPAGGVEPLAA